MNTVSHAHGTHNEQCHNNAAYDEDMPLIPGDLCLVDLSQGDCFNIDACCDDQETTVTTADGVAAYTQETVIRTSSTLE